ncbi:MAG: DUF4159 domain-containing protein [bacterium]
MKRFYYFLPLVLILVLIRPVWAQQGSNFVFCQLKYNGRWDPNPTSFGEIIHFLTSTTSIEAELQRREVTLKDKELSSAGFLYLTGTDDFASFSDEERENLRRYLTGGGVLLIDDALGQKNFGFDKAIRRELRQIFSDKKLEKMPPAHVIFRSYYLLRSVGGRHIISPYLESLDIDGRTAVIYCRNDLGGAWARDKLGNWLYPCMPGGEPQRLEAMKLTANIIIFSLSGTYKTDKIHEPFIENKLGSH